MPGVTCKVTGRLRIVTPPPPHTHTHSNGVQANQLLGPGVNFVKSDRTVKPSVTSSWKRLRTRERLNVNMENLGLLSANIQYFLRIVVPAVQIDLFVEIWYHIWLPKLLKKWLTCLSRSRIVWIWRMWCVTSKLHEHTLNYLALCRYQTFMTN